MRDEWAEEVGASGTLAGVAQRPGWWPWEPRRSFSVCRARTSGRWQSPAQVTDPERAAPPHPLRACPVTPWNLRVYLHFPLDECPVV